MKPGHAVSLIEAAYRLDVPTEQWLEGVAATAAAALESKGAMAFRYDASPGNWVHAGTMALHGLPPEFARDFFNQPDMPPEAVAALVRLFMTLRMGSVKDFMDAHGLARFAGVLEQYGVTDMVGVNGLDPSGRGVMLTIVDRHRERSARTEHVWHRLAAHISAGNRLRANLENLASSFDDAARRAEAVLSPSGKVEHATGEAEPRSAREALRDALVRIDASRSERDDARRSVDLWRGLVAGRWSLVEHFERDGKRYYLAHKNDPELTPDRALTERERQVLGYAELGHSNKLIAYELGLSSSTVSTLLGKARGKLRIPDA